MGPFRHFRLKTVRLLLLATAVVALGAWGISRAAAIGVLIGGITALLAFLTMAMNVQRLNTVPPHRLLITAYRWMAVRAAMYAVALYIAYRVDPIGFHGLLGAVTGLLLLRIAVTIAAALGLERTTHQ